MRWTPIASTTERIAGRPSGTAATARDTPTRRMLTRFDPVTSSAVRSMAATTTAAITTTAIPRARPMRLTSTWSGVSVSSAAPSISAMRPISVVMPVPTTTARPRPLATAVPW